MTISDRFVRKEPSKLVSIVVKPLNGENADTVSDPDLYVTNQFDGLVGVTKENFTWVCSSVGSARVDIHPSDCFSGRGNFFIIGTLILHLK